MIHIDRDAKRLLFPNPHDLTGKLEKATPPLRLIEQSRVKPIQRSVFMRRLMQMMILVFLAALTIGPPSWAANAPAVVVGRVSHIEGDLLRFVPAVQDWVAVVKDAPFGTEDTLFTGNEGMAELIIPNGSWTRLGYSTQVQFIALGQDVAEMDVAAGVARFYNKGTRTAIKATCPFGYVLAYPGTVFDLYVGEGSVEVIAVQGTVSFIHSATQAKYDAAAGYPSVLADQSQVSSGTGATDPAWDQWNATRENFWASKRQIRGWSTEILPPGLRDEAYTLEENGKWERIPYDGADRWFWRPTVVAPGWSPFTVGRWTDWNSDQTWVPDEPFGYVTHHYGNWVNVRGRWYWAPPVVTVRPGFPLLDIGFFWTPGRVSWIHSGAQVGWVPLAPRETYYGHRHWGGRYDRPYAEFRPDRHHVRDYAYASHAVVVNQTNFYTVNNYRTVQVTNINKTVIINNYKAAPVINNTVINNYTVNKQRFNFTNVTVREKPHNTVIDRIQHNEKVIRGEKTQNAAALEQQVKKVPEGKIRQGAKIEQPKISGKIVPVSEVNKPKSEIKLPQKEIRGSMKSPVGQPPGTPPAKPGVQQPPAKPGQPGVQQPPAKPGQPAVQQPGTPPGKPGVQPARPGQPQPDTSPGKPGVQQPPAKPGQPGQPGVQQPPRPGQPVVQPPAKPGQPGQQPGVQQPGTPPGKTGVQQPPRPGQPGQPGVQPARPQQPGVQQPGTPPGKTGVQQPPRPGQPGPKSEVTQPRPAQPPPKVEQAPPPRPQPQPKPQAAPPAPKPAPQPQAAPPPKPQPPAKPVPEKPVPDKPVPAKPGQLG
jgi:hypothetical protein